MVKRSKHLFSSESIKVKGMEHRAPCKHIFCPYTHTRLLGCSQKVKTFFSESSLVAGMEHRAPCKHIFCPYTHPQPSGACQKVKHFFLKVVVLHVKLKGIHGTGICSVLKHTLGPWGKVKRSKRLFLKLVMMHIKLKGMKQ